MRPAGEVHQALMRAAHALVAELAAAGRGVTLAELAERACVGRQVARDSIPNLRRQGHLQIVGERRVAYRNRPVAEYAPVDAPEDCRHGHGWVDLGRCVAGWAR